MKLVEEKLNLFLGSTVKQLFNNHWNNVMNICTAFVANYYHIKSMRPFSVNTFISLNICLVWEATFQTNCKQMPITSVVLEYVQSTTAKISSEKKSETRGLWA